MRQESGQPGFVLVLVLVVLAVAGTALAAAARRSSEAVAAAGDAERALQRKWGILGIQATCLPQAEAILIGRDAEAGHDGSDDEEVRREPVPVSRRFSLDLGGTMFDVTVADEQAKANANMLHHRRGKRGLETALRTLRPLTAVPVRVHLRPLSLDEEPKATDLLARYETFDQLFDAAGPDDLLGDGRGAAGVAGKVTCWGSGKVNLRRAGRDVLREVGRGCLKEFEIDKLVRLREEKPDVTAAEAIARLELDEKQRAEAGKLLTDTSMCHSLRIVVRGRTRSWHRLCVHQAVGAGGEGGLRVLAWEP